MFALSRRLQGDGKFIEIAYFSVRRLLGALGWPKIRLNLNDAMADNFFPNPTRLLALCVVLDRKSPEIWKKMA